MDSCPTSMEPHSTPGSSGSTSGTSYSLTFILIFSVHAIMYSYYFLASIHVRVPSAIAQSITTLQITQFAITHLVLFHVGYLALVGTPCDTTPLSYWYCLAMEISYIALFGNFFFHRYLRPAPSKKVESKKVE